MGHLLPTDGLRWIQEAQRALLSLGELVATDQPGAPGTCAVQEAWIGRTFEPLRRLLDTDHVYYVAPPLRPLSEATPASTSDGPPGSNSSKNRPSEGDGFLRNGSGGDLVGDSLVVISPSGGEWQAQRINEQFAGYRDGFMQLHDPYGTFLHAAARQYGVSALHDGLMYDPHDDSGLRRKSVIYREIYGPLGIERQMALSVPLPLGEAMLLVGYRQEEMPAFEGPEHSALKLLLPAFEAGLHFRRRLGAARRRWAALADALPDALAVFGATGDELYRNRALCRLLAAEPAAEALMRAVKAFGVETLPVLTSQDPATGSLPSYDGGPRRVALSSGSYWLRGSFDTSSLEAPVLLISVERTSTVPPAWLLRKHFGLTQREAEVAGLLAQGYTDRDVAEMLFISQHTARRHSERILKKMRLSSRAAIVHACLGTGEWR